MLLCGDGLIPMTNIPDFNDPFVCLSRPASYHNPVIGHSVSELLLPLLFLLSFPFLLASLGLGLFISTISYTQQQAMMSGFFFMLPSIILSGFIFPIANMPALIQKLTYLIPLRYYLVIIRSLLVKGVGVESLQSQIVALSLFAILIMGAAAARFRKRLD